MSIDYRLYLVTDRGILGNRDIFEAVEQAILGGVTLVQLREKDVSSKDFYDIALKMKAVTRQYGVPFIINDRLDVALAVDADGLHIGQEDLPLTVARKLLGKGKILGYSVSIAEEAVYGEKNGADYLGAGPVFPTGSKLDASSPIGLTGLKKVVKSVSIPVVGIGGIGVDNLYSIKEAGADGISLISAILGKEDIRGASKNLIDIWENR